MGFVRLYDIQLAEGSRSSDGRHEGRIAAQGMGCRSVAAAPAYGLDVFGLQRVEAKAYGYNVLSANALRRNGSVRRVCSGPAPVPGATLGHSRLPRSSRRRCARSVTPDRYPYVGFCDPETIHKLLPSSRWAESAAARSALAGDRRHRRHYTFAGVVLALAVWNIGVFGLRGAPDAETAVVWEYVVHLGVIPLPALFYHYVLAFLEVRPHPRLLGIGYAIATALLVASPTPLFIAGVAETHWGYVPRSGPLYAPFFLYFQTYLVLGLVRLMRAHRSVVSSFRRNRTRLVIVGVLVSLAGGIVDFLRFILGWEHLYPFGIPTNALFAMALGLAIVR